MAPPRASLSSMSGLGSGPGDTSPQESETRKRVPKACDRCRLKKIKCDGQIPCSRCGVENSICRYGERKATTERRIPPGYVEYLEEQQELLVRALKKCYGMVEGVQGDEPSAHTILESLGVFADFPVRHQQESGFHFEEDLDALREKCEAEGATVSSASTTASQIVSAEPTPSRLSPEPEGVGAFPFPASRSRTWSPFPPGSPQTIARQRIPPPPAISGPPPMFLPQNASAPPSVYESPGPDVYQGSNWPQVSLAQVHSEPTLASQMNYWPPPPLPPPPQQQSQQQQQQASAQQWSQGRPSAEQQYDTVDPARLMLPATTEAYIQSAQAWAEYLREQQRRQR